MTLQVRASALAAAAICVTGAVLSACGASSAAPKGSTTTTHAPPETTTTVTTTTPQPSSTTTSPTTTGSISSCSTGQLTLSYQTKEPAGGIQPGLVVLTNSGPTVCTVSGYPGVSFLNSANQPVGPAADRTSGSGSVVTLQSRQQASSYLQILEGGCGSQPPVAAYLQVYPPNQTTALTAPVNVNACTSHVFPLQAGASFPNA
jgi:hypothetical protein